MYRRRIRIIKEFHEILDDSGDNVLNRRLEFDERRKLKKFTLNLTMSIHGKRRAIVRYDCAHGFLHMHRFYRKPPTTERISREVSLETAKELTREMTANWERWKNILIENYGEIR